MKKLIYIFCLLMIVSMPIMAQEEELGTDNAPSMGGDVPVDGGLSLLLAAGAAFGGRSLYRANGKKRK